MSKIQEKDLPVTGLYNSQQMGPLGFAVLEAGGGTSTYLVFTIPRKVWVVVVLG
jgi:hypothetical protein